jgi:hypothetical protein
MWVVEGSLHRPHWAIGFNKTPGRSTSPQQPSKAACWCNSFPLPRDLMSWRTFWKIVAFAIRRCLLPAAATFGQVCEFSSRAACCARNTCPHLPLPAHSRPQQSSNVSTFACESTRLLFWDPARRANGSPDFVFSLPSLAHDAAVPASPPQARACARCRTRARCGGSLRCAPATVEPSRNRRPAALQVFVCP